MSSSGQNNVIAFFTPIINLGSFLGVVPPYSFEKSATLHRTYYKIKTTILAVTFVVLGLVCATLRNKMLRDGRMVSGLLLGDLLSVTSGHCLVIYAIISSHSKRGIWEMVFRELSSIDNNKSRTHKFEAKKKQPNAKRYIYIVHSLEALVYFGILIRLEIYYPENYLLLIYPEQECLLLHYVITITFVIVAVLLQLKSKFKELNVALNGLKYIQLENEHILQVIAEVDILYLRLFNILNGFKDICQPLLFLLLNYSFFNCFTYYHYLAHWAYRDDIFDTVSIIIYLLVPFLCLLACDATRKEIQSITRTCLNTAQYFPQKSEIYHTLFDLCYRTGTMKIEFTAVGFFKINRTIMISMLAATGTYFIAAEGMYQSNS